MTDTKNLMCYGGKKVTTSTCNALTGWNGIVYDPQQMCIEGTVSTNSACFHDGGAPAVNDNMIHALYSYPDMQQSGNIYPKNSSCNQKSKPGVFTQVNQYISWIHTNMT